MLPLRLDPWFDAILRKHLQKAARAQGVAGWELQERVRTPEDAIRFLREADGDAYMRYVEEACEAVDNVGWILVDKRTGRQLVA